MACGEGDGWTSSAEASCGSCSELFRIPPGANAAQPPWPTTRGALSRDPQPVRADAGMAARAVLGRLRSERPARRVTPPSYRHLGPQQLQPQGLLPVPTALARNAGGDDVARASREARERAGWTAQPPSVSLRCPADEGRWRQMGTPPVSTIRPAANPMADPPALFPVHSCCPASAVSQPQALVHVCRYIGLPLRTPSR